MLGGGFQCVLLLVWDETRSLILFLLSLSVVCVSESSLWFPNSVTLSSKNNTLYDLFFALI